MKDNRQLDSAFERKLLEATDYRAFLALFFIKSPGVKSFTYEQFAKKAGFGSKSFIFEVIRGKKKLSPTSLQKTAAALDLSDTWSTYFKALVARDETAFHVAKKTENNFVKILQVTRKKIIGNSPETWFSETMPQSQITMNEGMTELCVAAGHPEKGATAKQIQALVRRPLKEIEPKLTALTNAGVLKYNFKTGRYQNVPSASNTLHVSGST